MTRGRKRKHDPTIPAHIDQRKLPERCYWDRRDRVWYTLLPGTKVTRKKVSGPQALLSELHTAMEQLRGVNRNSIQWLTQQYHASHVFQALAKTTQASYLTQQRIALAQPTKVGKLGDLDFARLETHHFQALIDRLAGEGTPSKANAMMRYLKLVYSWAKQRGHVRSNPVQGVKQAKERKRRRLPEPVLMIKLIQYAAERGQRLPHTKGSSPPYLWAVADIAYLCRLRGIEVITLTDDAMMDEGLRTNRRKGSRDNIVTWTPRLRTAVEALQNRRDTIWRTRRMAVPIMPKERPLVVAQDGGHLDKSSLDSAWQRLIQAAIKEQIITTEERFGLHDLKRRGVTDTVGTRADKQDASGHRSEAMLDVYDLSLPIVKPSAEG